MTVININKATANIAPFILLYGSEGDGKTTLATKFPKPVALLFERGLPQGVELDAVEDVASFDNAMAALRELYGDVRGYQSLIIDTVDAFEPLVVAATCAEHNWKNIETPSFGKRWVAADLKWRQFLKALTAIRDKHDMTIVLTCHAAVERIDDPRAPSYTSYQPRLHRRARALVMDAADAVFFLGDDLRVVSEEGGFTERTRGANDGRRYLFTERKPAFAAKNRFGMPSKVPVGIDFDITELTKFWHSQ
jgi:AAA domain